MPNFFAIAEKQITIHCPCNPTAVRLSIAYKFGHETIAMIYLHQSIIMCCADEEIMKVIIVKVFNFLKRKATFMETNGVEYFFEYFSIQTLQPFKMNAPC